MKQRLSMLVLCLSVSIASSANPAKPDPATIDATLARTITEDCIDAIRKRLHDPAAAELPSMPWTGLPQSVSISQDKNKSLFVKFDFRGRNAFNALRLQRAQCKYQRNDKGDYLRSQVSASPL